MWSMYVFMHIWDQLKKWKKSMLCLLPWQLLRGKSFEISPNSSISYPNVAKLSLFPNSVYCPFFINHISSLINVCSLSHCMYFNYISTLEIIWSNYRLVHHLRIDKRAFGEANKNTRAFRDAYIDTHTSIHRYTCIEFIHMHMMHT